LLGEAVTHAAAATLATNKGAARESLKEYKSKLIVFPRKRGKPKAGDADAAELDKAAQLTGPILPMPAAVADEEPVTITAEMKSVEAFHKIRMARADFRLFGVRQKNRLAKELKD